ncbi:hypothetical protein HDV02_001227 [Globomyces sp. JEL0801]|nr:hypothetical protein HDV02_001227 [Globomyces sp. JEL0801]
MIEKLHSSGQITSQKPLDVELINDSIKIKWPKESYNLDRDEHISVFPIEWLKRFDYSNAYKPAIKPISWDARILTEKRETVDFNDFMTNEGLKKALSQIRDYGLCFLKNVPSDNPKQVELVGEQFGTILDTFYGRNFDVINDPKSKNIAYTSLFLDLHMDLLYFEAPPGIQLLHCIKNNVKGGTSLFLDLHRIVEDLRKNHPHEYGILTQVPVRYSYENDGRHFEYIRTTITENINDGFHLFYAPPFQGPIHCPPAMVDDFYKAFGVLENLIHDPKGIYRYLLNEGDVAIFANRRVLHGRDQFDPTSGERWLKGTYVSWDEFKDKIRVNGLVSK